MEAQARIDGMQGNDRVWYASRGWDMVFMKMVLQEEFKQRSWSAPSLDANSLPFL
jgi:hypothetical protein